ncbi:hypothetical protein BST81_23365 [Leptolyngbya sp. 'hensonii']|nr:hypothetical protein BST81_23365 [Leptolyngbya sp. 'hensonii']
MLQGITVSLIMGTGLILPFSSSLLAQSTPGSQPLQDFKPQEENRDIFSGKGAGQNSGLFDFIHRANMGNIRSNTEFQADTTQNLNDAAAQFRAQQLRLLQQQQNNGQQPGLQIVPATPSSGSK